MSCINEPLDESLGEVDGFVPVYSTPDQSELKVVAPTAIKSPGKIYIYNQYLLVNEINRGIHVFDNSVPAQPRPIGFIQLVGNSDMAIKDDVLYADHMGDLVALTFENFELITERGRLPLSSWNSGVPPPKSQYFACIDPSQGLVVAWKSAKLFNPECYAY